VSSRAEHVRAPERRLTRCTAPSCWRESLPSLQLARRTCASASLASYPVRLQLLAPPRAPLAGGPLLACTASQFKPLLHSAASPAARAPLLLPPTVRCACSCSLLRARRSPAVRCSPAHLLSSKLSSIPSSPPQPRPPHARLCFSRQLSGAPAAARSSARAARRQALLTLPSPHSNGRSSSDKDFRQAVLHGRSGDRCALR